MSEIVVHELVTVTADEAGRLETEFLNGLDQAQDAFVRIMETNAWAALGHDSFAAWWEQRVVPTMRALSMRPSREIADRVLDQIRQEEAGLPPAQRRRGAELAELAGVSEWVVESRQDQRPPRSTAKPDLAPAEGQPDGNPTDEPSEGVGCESCGNELDEQSAQVGYLRCEDCDSESEHVSSTFPDSADGLCVVCHPGDPQVQEWLESARPENVFGKYHDPDKHGGAGAPPEPSQSEPIQPLDPEVRERLKRERENREARERYSKSLAHSVWLLAEYGRRVDAADWTVQQWEPGQDIYPEPVTAERLRAAGDFLHQLAEVWPK